MVRRVHQELERHLEDLAHLPRIDDRLASQWTKGVARVVKYLKELDRSGRAFADAELDEFETRFARALEVVAATADN